MSSSYHCPRCRTTWGFYIGTDPRRRIEHNRQVKECIARKCRPWWLRILIGRRSPRA